MVFDKNVPYDISYKHKFKEVREIKGHNRYDIFISAYNNSYRVQEVFNNIDAVKKHWLVFSEYRYCREEISVKDESNISVYELEGNKSEGEVIRQYFEGLDLALSEANICIDITGFIRPHLLFLIRYLHSKGIKKFDCLYSDPIKYKKSEETSFSDLLTRVRQVDGFQGAHNPDSSNDYLFIASGFDSTRISNVSENKKNSKKVQIFGLPSLQPDMFQQNILKAYNASEESSHAKESFLDTLNTLYAPANDPFITAKNISLFLKKILKTEEITNLYLSPLSTKVQTLGIALFYIAECLEKEVSVIFPFCDKYSRETTEGLSRIWIYEIDFEIINPN